MATNHLRSIPVEVIRRLQRGSMSRRDALRMLGALGIMASGLAANRGAAAQDATPEPLPQAGLRPDGTRVWQVQVAGDSEPDVIEYNAFFPRELTINAGDTVVFLFKGLHAPHTVTFPSGQPIPKLIVPASDDGTPVAGTVPEIMFNPAAVFPSGGDTYDGSSPVNSGLSALLPPPQSFSLTFTTPGTFDYLCLVHPLMMKGTVTVQEQGAAVPLEQADVDGMVAEHMAALLAEGRSLIAKYGDGAPPTVDADGRTVWDVRAGAEGEEVAVYRFLPDSPTIKAGDTVRWTDRSKMEPHTVTFLGGTEPPDLIEPRPQESGPPKLTFNPDFIGRVGADVYSGTGFVNSGAMGADFEEYTGLTTYELTFDTPGEYPYYCALHGDPTMGMRAKITVT